MYCLVKRQEENIRKYKDEAVKAAYMKEVFKIIANAGDNATAPYLIAEINMLHQKVFHTAYSFDELKLEYNNLILQKEPSICKLISSSKDSLLEAVKFARVGNYIDFGAMGKIEDEKLEQLLESAVEDEVDPKEYTAFVKDLKDAKSLVYLTDNCGEIVLDKIFIRVMKERFPELAITVIVRGGAVLNDATIEDAKQIGLTDIAEVIGNGTLIAGTQLEDINPEAREKLANADIIISKGQGNFETLHGCGLNIYYMFLCKCDWFVTRFGLERYKGVFLNERNISDKTLSQDIP